MRSLKYVSYSVTMQEVPDEVSLVINISGCPYRCDGCHSKYLWEYKGHNLKEDIGKIYMQYEGLISCICFMGGDQNINELYEMMSFVKSKNIKTCLYTGNDDINFFKELISVIDYIKIGHYSEEHGGLQSENSNQRMYKITNNKIEDITNRFHRIK